MVRKVSKNKVRRRLNKRSRKKKNKRISRRRSRRRSRRLRGGTSLNKEQLNKQIVKAAGDIKNLNQQINQKTIYYQDLIYKLKQELIEKERTLENLNIGLVKLKKFENQQNLQQQYKIQQQQQQQQQQRQQQNPKISQQPMYVPNVPNVRTA